MRNLTRTIAALVTLSVLSGSACAQDKLSGSGSTFIKPIMDKWIAEYTKARGGRINYQSQGSGAGINQMTNKAVDFGCTDAFMKPDQRRTAKQKGGEVIHVPLAMGAIAIAYNLPGLAQPLNLTGEVLADIYLHKIEKWNDPRIAELNPKVELPNLNIAAIQRADASGSTAIFTEFLCKHSSEWEKTVGTGTKVNFPKGGVAENQTAGVAGAISKSVGSIGYIELFYALQNKIPFAALKNSDGKFIEPSLESVSEASAAMAKAKKIEDHLRYSLVDAPGANSYPLSGTTWAVLFVAQDDVGQANALKAFLTWILHDGQSYTKAMHYAPLPEEIVRMAEANVAKIHGK